MILHKKVWRHSGERGRPNSLGGLRSSSCFQTFISLFLGLSLFPGLPIAFQTAAASLVSAAWRMFIMPIDTVKTTLQVLMTASGSQNTNPLTGGGPGCCVPAPQEGCSGRSRCALAWSLGCGNCNSCRPLSMVSHIQHPPVFSGAKSWASAKCLDRPCGQPGIGHVVKLLASAENSEADKP